MAQLRPRRKAFGGRLRCAGYWVRSAETCVFLHRIDRVVDSGRYLVPLERWESVKGGTPMASEIPFQAFIQDVADKLEPYGIDVELITRRQDRPGLLSCRRLDSGRTVFLLADPADCSHARAAVLADFVRQEIPHV
ncbi:MAG TPA: hypothetical protein VFI12_09865 [Thermomicrobiales bacterium]|nr:hypothetical protein [Thermomicrobiales bacterium]